MVLAENKAHYVEVLNNFHFFIPKLIYKRHCESVTEGDLSWITTQHNATDFSGSDDDPNAANLGAIYWVHFIQGLVLYGKGYLVSVFLHMMHGLEH